MGVGKQYDGSCLESRLPVAADDEMPCCGPAKRGPVGMGLSCMQRQQQRSGKQLGKCNAD